MKSIVIVTKIDKGAIYKKVISYSIYIPVLSKVRIEKFYTDLHFDFNQKLIGSSGLYNKNFYKEYGPAYIGFKNEQKLVGKDPLFNEKYLTSNFIRKLLCNYNAHPLSSRIIIVKDFLKESEELSLKETSNSHSNYLDFAAYFVDLNFKDENEIYNQQEIEELTGLFLIHVK